MDLDWCYNNNLTTETNFNENLIINKEKKQIIESDINQVVINDKTNIDDCFRLDLNVSNSKELLPILNYLLTVSNYLRSFIRNKGLKNTNYINITNDEFLSIQNYLNWLLVSCSAIKKFFSTPLRKDNSFDPSGIKLFKTSSYKFCNFKESCSIHRNKSKCDKNHFVFNMIINDISKLIESINIIGIDNINWILSCKNIKAIFFENEKKYIFEKILDDDIPLKLDDSQFIIDKTIIFKSFDVISFVINKMYSEAFYFLYSDIETNLITFS